MNNIDRITESLDTMLTLITNSDVDIYESMTQCGIAIDNLYLLSDTLKSLKKA